MPIRTFAFSGLNALAFAATSIVFLATAAGQTTPKPSFVARTDYAVGSGAPFGIAVGDLNSDGNLDLVTLSYTGSVSVLLGNVDGSFQPAVNYSVPVNSIIMQLGDFDGDGKSDIFVATSSTSTVGIVSVSVLLGNGDGTFQAQKLTNIASNSNSTCVAVGDFNGDGKLDLAIPVSVPQQGDSAMTVMLGNGDGTFQAAIPANPGPFPTPYFLKTADFNGDGIPDLVSASVVVGEISVFLGNGDGTFQQPNNTPAGVRFGGFVVADFTGDGKLDIATEGVQVLPGNGDGTFQAAIVTDFGVSGAVSSDDLNGDGVQDLELVDPGSGTSVLLGNGDGTFQLPGLVTVLPGTAAVFGDFDRDGKVDIATNTSDSTGRGVVSVAFGNGDGTFQVDTFLNVFSGFSYYPVSVLADDFTGDGKTDLLEVLGSIRSGPAGAVLPGNGNGTFQAPTWFGVQSCPANLVLVPCPSARADLNGDGKLDAVITGAEGAGASVVGVFLGNGDGTFRPEVDYRGAGSSIALGDINGDGNIDIVTSGDSANSLSLLFGNGDGTFGFPTTVAINESADFVAMADLNKDGHLDLAVATGSAVAILLGNGDGTFQSEIDISTPAGATTLAVADLNGDGNPDIVAASSTSNMVSVLLGDGSGTSFSVATYPVLGGNAIYISVGDFNGDGIPDLAVLNSLEPDSSVLDVADVSILVGKGDGTFQPAVNFGTRGIYDSQLAVADFNADGSPDIAVGASLLFNRATGAAASLTPTLAEFGNTAVGLTSGSQLVTLSNTGTKTLSISRITLTGPQSADFAQTNTCGASLAVGQNCEFQVSFTPSAPGLRRATIQIVDNAFNTPQIITLTGTGVTSAPGATLAPGAVSFGNQALGVASSPQPVTLTNTGNASLTIDSITITGPQSSEFAETNTCGTSIAAGAKCTISTTFTPTASGSRSATLNVTDNAGDSPQTAALTGTGISSLKLGTSNGSATIAAGQPANYTLSIGGGGFSGTATLTCTGAPKGAVCSLPASETVDAVTATQFTVMVSTTARTSAAITPNTSPLNLSLWALAIFGMVLLPGSATRSYSRRRLIRTLPIALLLFLCSCGGGDGSSGAQTGTPAGMYTLTVTAKSGSATQSVPLTLMVQ
jgi:FG-GAP-like repeat/Abnormal spindle-like microcephaly-assoc'd, ASPM-SPD-2-Hydin